MACSNLLGFTIACEDGRNLLHGLGKFSRWHSRIHLMVWKDSLFYSSLETDFKIEA